MTHISGHMESKQVSYSWHFRRLQDSRNGKTAPGGVPNSSIIE